MKHIMYVFSGTGNTLHIAKLVREALVGEEITIQAINGDNDETVTAEIVGFYFPCYYGSIPQLVQRFVSHLNISKDIYVYSVTTAGRSSGYANKDLSRLLAKKGVELNFAEDVLYANNYMPGWYYKMMYKTENKIKGTQDKFIEKTQKIAKRIKNKEKIKIKASFSGYHLPQIMSPSYLIKDTRRYDTEFEVGDKCNYCGLCVKVCPVNNIEIKNGKHYFNHNCQRCMACVQYCSKQAFVIKGKAMNKERYINPFVSNKEMIEFHHNIKI